MTTLYEPSEDLERSFQENGYLTFEGVVDRSALTRLTQTLLAEFDQAKRDGRLFTGGGVVSGHLNCFPGSGSRFVYEELEAKGILDVVRSLSPTALRAPNIGCNLNLPGSNPQNEHVDGYAAEPFLIINVAAVDTYSTNGAMEILKGTSKRRYKYWELLLESPKRYRHCMQQGDVLIRTSTLWHRGMPNLSRTPRPMLAFTWENGGSALADPYAVHDGKVTFLPNRYGTDLAGRLRESAFVAAPRVGTLVRAVQSLFES